MTSLRIATVRGIPIRAHVSLLFALPLLAFVFSEQFRAAAELAGVPPSAVGGAPWIWGVVVAVVLFLSVLVHELAHSLYALRKGGRVRDITLLFIGGVSQVSEAPRAPRHEAVMALVGPLVSLVLGGLFLGLSAIAGETSFGLRFGLFYVGGLNLMLGVFNLLPAFPMDGGRVLRAALVPRLGLVRATRIAARVGMVFAVLFAVLGFVSGNLLLVMVAFFVFLGAQAETNAVMMKAAIGGLRVADVMRPSPPTISGALTVADVAARMLRERRDAYVVEGHGGVITVKAVKGVPPAARATTLAAQLAVPVPTVTPDTNAGEALRRMGESGVHRVAVVEEGRVIGLVGRDDIARALELGELEATTRREERPAW
jgi:Zn-dependent protease